MRIAHFIGTNFVGGPERQILSHVRQAQGMNNEFVIISFAEPGGYALQELAQQMGIETVLLPAGRWQLYAVCTELHRFYQRWRPGAICAHGYKATFYSALAQVFSKSKYIAFSRGWTTENLKVKLYHRLEGLLIRFADRVVAVSKAQRQQLKKLLIPDNKIAIVENAVTIGGRTSTEDQVRDEVREELGLSKEDQIILSAGRLSPEKGHEFLIAALDDVSGKIAGTHLLMAGDGPLRKELHKQASSAQHADHIHFLGFRKDMRRLFLAADVFVLPSLSEGLPNVILEAMALEVPVVATRVGGVPELVSHECTGLLVEARNPQDLSRALCRLLEDIDDAKTMAERALQLVNSDYSAASQTSRLLRLYKDVMDG